MCSAWAGMLHPVAVLQRETKPQFAARGGKKPQDVFAIQWSCAAPCSASSLVGALKAVEKNCGSEQRSKSFNSHYQEMGGSRSWWLCRGKPEWVTMRRHREKIRRNPGFFPCPAQIVPQGSRWVQGSLAVTLCAWTTPENLPMPQHCLPLPRHGPGIVHPGSPLAPRLHCQALSWSF